MNRFLISEFDFGGNFSFSFTGVVPKGADINR